MKLRRFLSAIIVLILVLAVGHLAFKGVKKIVESKKTEVETQEKQVEPVEEKETATQEKWLELTSFKQNDENTYYILHNVSGKKICNVYFSIGEEYYLAGEVDTDEYFAVQTKSKIQTTEVKVSNVQISFEDKTTIKGDVSVSSEDKKVYIDFTNKSDKDVYVFVANFFIKDSTGRTAQKSVLKNSDNQVKPGETKRIEGRLLDGESIILSKKSIVGWTYAQQ